MPVRVRPRALAHSDSIALTSRCDGLAIRGIRIWDGFSRARHGYGSRRNGIVPTLLSVRTCQATGPPENHYKKADGIGVVVTCRYQKRLAFTPPFNG